MSHDEARDQHRAAALAWLSHPDPQPRPALRRSATATQRLDPVTITAHLANEPLSTLAELLVLDASLSLSFPAHLATLPINVSWTDRDALAALEALAASLGLIAVVRGPREVELAPERSSDVEVMAISPAYDTPAQVHTFISRVLSSVGGAEIVGSQVIVADIPDRLPKLQALADVLSAERSQWLVEAKFIELRSSWDRRIGAELRASGTLSATFSATDLLDPARGGALLVELLAEASQGSRDARTIATTRLYCVDGRSARSDFGQRTPIPLRTVSDQGTVTTVRYDTVSTGVILDVSLRELPNGAAMLTITPEVSSVSGFVDQAPIISQSRLTAEAVIESGGVLLLGGLDFSEASTAVGGTAGGGLGLGYREASDSVRRSVVIVVRAERVRNALGPPQALPGGRGSSEGEGPRPPRPTPPPGLLPLASLHTQRQP